jgi:hypothetical protein
MNVIKKMAQKLDLRMLGWINKESNIFWRPGPETSLRQGTQ